MSVAGCEDVGHRRGDVCCSLVSLPLQCRLQFVREHQVLQLLVPSGVTSYVLPQQRKQPHPLQRHVEQVQGRLQGIVSWEVCASFETHRTHRPHAGIRERTKRKNNAELKHLVLGS